MRISLSAAMLLMSSLVAGCAAPAPPVAPWHVSTITPGGQAAQNGTAILLNDKTGQTWFWGCDGHAWIPLTRDQAAPAAPTPPSVSNGSEQDQQNTIETGLTPRDAAVQALQAIRVKLGLTVYVTGPSGPVDSDSDPNDVKSDRFSAAGGFSVASNRSGTLDCEWIADGRTAVTLQSNLPKAQHDRVLQVVRDAAATPPTIAR